MPRTARISRTTAETAIELDLNLDGSGQVEIATGVGFFDHMLTLLARHSLIDLTVKAVGDLHVDAHHTVEDVGICFGKATAARRTVDQMFFHADDLRRGQPLANQIERQNVVVDVLIV